MKVIGVVGLPASGKGEFSNIAREMGIPVIVMGDVIRGEVSRAGLEPTDENMGLISRRLREKDGMAAIAKACIPVIEATGAPLVVVDGIRGDAEVVLFKEHFTDFLLVSIEAPADIRLARLSLRGRPDDAGSLAELENRDKREGTWGLFRAIGRADHRLENRENLLVYREQARRLLRDIAGDR